MNSLLDPELARQRLDAAALGSLSHQHAVHVRDLLRELGDRPQQGRVILDRRETRDDPHDERVLGHPQLVEQRAPARLGERLERLRIEEVRDRHDARRRHATLRFDEAVRRSDCCPRRDRRTDTRIGSRAGCGPAGAASATNVGSRSLRALLPVGRTWSRIRSCRRHDYARRRSARAGTVESAGVPAALPRGPSRLLIGKGCTGIPASLYRAISGPSAWMHTTDSAKRDRSSRSAVRTAFSSVPPTCMLSMQYTTRIGSPDDRTAKRASWTR